MIWSTPISYPLWKDSTQHPELYSPPYHSQLKTTLQWTKNMSTVTLVWSLWSLWPCATRVGTIAFIWALLDAMMATLTIRSVFHIPSFVPMDRCRNHNMTTWHVPPSHESLFVILADTPKSTIQNNSPHRVCEEFRKLYFLLLAQGVALAVAAVCNITLIWGRRNMIDRNAPDLKRLFWIHFTGWPWRRTSWPKSCVSCWFIACLIEVFLLGPPTLLIFVLTRPIHRWIWITYRCCAKFTTGLKISAVHYYKQLRFRRQLKQSHEGLKRSEPPTLPPKNRINNGNLAELLNYDILIVVATNLCYRDIINLSRVSKRLRHTIFDKEANFEELSHHWQQYTCDQESRNNCPVCKIAMCGDCDVRPMDSFSSRAVSSHHGCHLSCFTCFNIITNRTSTSRCHCTCVVKPFARACNFCTPSTLPTSIFYGSYDRPGKVDKKVLLARWKARHEMEVKERCKDENLCFECQEPVGGLLRFWVCIGCRKECRHAMHSAWRWSREPMTASDESGIANEIDDGDIV
ncbi:hypothetical protein BT63DRAFT_478741 [Microthyrium microscopicum]|uniref:F-box domain-containing protein n=1 Tax=Microthyrium microscopicum TaxID=703497 RepID=A0A6A6UHQ0_9PEZI|nr:hypothetical protein BT63DRAFT_478741 [Microthyrium microscopicum]